MFTEYYLTIVDNIFVCKTHAMY